MLAASLLYGVSAFVCGFVFGAVRELLLRPRFGDTDAHLIEFPFVTSCVCVIGIYLIRWKRVSSYVTALTMGVGGVTVVLLLESWLALHVMKIDVDDYLHSFDIRDGQLFPVGLLLMWLAPTLGVHSDGDVACTHAGKQE